MFDWLTQEVSHSAITYPVVGFSAAADVLFPLIPSETIIITASVLAAQGDLLIWVIVPAVAIGAFLGDNLCYLLGRRIGDPIADRLFDDEKGQARLQAAGTLEMPYRQFAAADALAASIWALYVSMLGYLGGETFQDSLWLPLATTFACAMLVGLGFEGWRRLQSRRGKDILGDELPEEMAT